MAGQHVSLEKFSRFLNLMGSHPVFAVVTMGQDLNVGTGKADNSEWWLCYGRYVQLFG